MMIEGFNRSAVARCLAVASAAFLIAVAVHAEVGGLWGPGPTTPLMGGYKFGQIWDDPDPIGQIWHQYAYGSAGRVPLNPEGEANRDGDPSMLSDSATGLLVVAWSKNTPNGYDIVVSQFANGAWTSPQVVAASAANDLDPQLVLDPSGVLHLFYWVDGPSPQVFHIQAPIGSSSWSAPILVSQPNEPACRPAGAVYQGTLHVAYELHDFGFGNSPREVVLARFDGTSFVPEVVAVTNNVGPVTPQVHAHAGHLWIDWVDAETTGHSGEVGWTRLDAQGHWEPIHYQSFSNAEQRDFIVRGSVRMQAIQ